MVVPWATRRRQKCPESVRQHPRRREAPPHGYPGSMHAAVVIRRFQHALPFHAQPLRGVAQNVGHARIVGDEAEVHDDRFGECGAACIDPDCEIGRPSSRKPAGQRSTKLKQAKSIRELIHIY